MLAPPSPALPRGCLAAARSLCSHACALDGRVRLSRQGRHTPDPWPHSQQVRRGIESKPDHGGIEKRTILFSSPHEGWK